MADQPRAWMADVAPVERDTASAGTTYGRLARIYDVTPFERPLLDMSVIASRRRIR